MATFLPASRAQRHFGTLSEWGRDQDPVDITSTEQIANLGKDVRAARPQTSGLGVLIASDDNVQIIAEAEPLQVMGAARPKSDEPDPHR